MTEVLLNIKSAFDNMLSELNALKVHVCVILTYVEQEMARRKTMKIIEVENCGECPYRDGMGCSRTMKDLRSIKEIPDHCPLEEG